MDTKYSTKIFPSVKRAPSGLFSLISVFMKSSVKNEFVNATCLDGLEILKEHKLVFLATPSYDLFADHSCGNGELVESGNDGTAFSEASGTATSAWRNVFVIIAFIRFPKAAVRNYWRGHLNEVSRRLS